MLAGDERITRWGDDGRWTFYGMKAWPDYFCQAPELAITSIDDGHTPIDVKRFADRDAATQWTTGRPQRRGDTIQLDLGNAAHLCDVGFSIGPKWDAFPRDLEFSTSTDGTAWTRRFNGSPAGLLVRGALANPRDIRLTVPLGSAYARFVRLRLNASHPTEPWLMTQLRVTGSQGDKRG